MSRIVGAAREEKGWTLVDTVILLLLIVPIYGCFWPPDSYMSLGAVEGEAVTQTKSLPITNVLLVLMSVAAGWLLYIVYKKQSTIQRLYLGYAFVILAFSSAAWAVQPDGTVLRALRLLPPITMAVALAQVLPLPRILRIITIGLLISAIISIAIVLIIPAYGLTYASGRIDVAWRGAMVQKISLVSPSASV